MTEHLASLKNLQKFHKLIAHDNHRKIPFSRLARVSEEEAFNDELAHCPECRALAWAIKVCEDLAKAPV